MAAPTTLTVGKHKTLAIAPTDANGNPAPVTNIQWIAANADVTLAPAADGLSAVVLGVTTGDVVVSVSAVNSESTTLNDSITITVVAAPVPVATALNLTAGPEF